MSGGRTGWKVYILLLILPFIMAPVSTGCFFKYKQFVEDKGIAHFSFEYPADLDEHDRVRSREFVSASFYRCLVEDGWWDKRLYVIAEKPPVLGFEDVYDAATMLDRYISRMKNDFEVAQVLERSSVNISGVSGEQVVYTYDEYSGTFPLFDAPLEGHPGGPSLIWIDRLICFDHNGLVWFIRMKSVEGAAEKTRLDFEHFIQTFKILE